MKEFGRVSRFAGAVYTTLWVVAIVAFAGCAADTLPSDSSYLNISRGETDYTGSRSFRFDPIKKDSATIFYTFTISNTTKEHIEITRIECSSPDNFTFYSSSLPGELPPEGSIDFELGFHPLSEGSHESTLSMYLSGSEEPFIFQVFGNGL